MAKIEKKKSAKRNYNRRYSVLKHETKVNVDGIGQLTAPVWLASIVDRPELAREFPHTPDGRRDAIAYCKSNAPGKSQMDIARARRILAKMRTDIMRIRHVSTSTLACEAVDQQLVEIIDSLEDGQELE